MTSVSADELDRALQISQQHIQAKRFAEAVVSLNQALPQTDSLPAEVQVQARTAIHFYMAVALSGMGNDVDALEHIDEVLRLSPRSAM